MTNATPTIAVMGSTGRTGNRIARALLAAGVNVRALGRSAEKMGALKALGAQVCAGDSADQAYLRRAFTGCDAVYTLMPFEAHVPGYAGLQRAQGEAIASALAQSRVPYAVALSSLGADQPEGTGVLQSLYLQEQRLRAVPGLNLLLLRPGAFFEAILAMLPAVKYEGVLADSFAPDVGVPMIATKDVADAAITALLARDWTGERIVELAGPRDVTHRELAGIVGKAIGLDGLVYQQLPCEQMAQVLTGAGLAPDLAQLLGEYTKAMNEGRIRMANERNAANSGGMAVEDFADEIRAAYNAL
jgi:uncharacterized protein YbjT (DUF2867 family)